MADDPPPTFCGRYVLSLPGTAEPVFVPPLGWLVAASDGSLMLQYDTFPLDGSGFFNCFALTSGAIVFQAVASGKYLALGEKLDSTDTAIVASAAAPDQALQLYATRSATDVYTGVLLYGTNPYGFIGCSVSIYSPSYNTRSEPTAAFQSFSLMCVVPGAPLPPPPSSISALRYATETDRTQERATSRQSAWRRATALTTAVTSTGDPPTPYFCGKYAATFPEGWIFRSGNAAATPPIPPSVGITKAFPADGSGLFIGYRQQPITWDSGHQNMAAMSWQTIPGPWSQSGSAASPPTGGFLDEPTSGQTIIVNSGVTAVEKTTPFCVFSPDQGPVFILGQSSSYGWYIEPSTSDDNPVLGIINDPSQWTRPLLTRLVAGLQDVLAPGASNWWDGADLSYVNMTTCVGSLTGAAAQWGNANFTGAILSKMDLRTIAIGNAVNFTNAALAGAQFKTGQDFTHATLAGADLSGVDLSAVTFGSANLNGANLTSAVLTKVDLSQTTCVGTDFSSCDLTTTSLPMASGALGQGSSTGAKFTARCTVPFASLGNDWRNLNLSTAQLGPPKATGTISALRADAATLQNTILDGMAFAADDDGMAASFQYADLTGASLKGVSAESATFSGAFLDGAVLTNADLTSTTWSNSFAGTAVLLFVAASAQQDISALNAAIVPQDLLNAFAGNNHPLKNPQVTVRVPSTRWLIKDSGNSYSVVVVGTALNVYTNTTGGWAHLDGVCLQDADLTGGSFPGVDFTGAQLTDGANGSGVDFEGAVFTSANISSATANQPNFQNACLYGATLNDAFMFNANLAGAILSPSQASAQAKLHRAMLAGTTLSSAQLDFADMTGAFVAVTPEQATFAFAGVPLFTLDAGSFTSILNICAAAKSPAPAPAELQGAFQGQNISLSGPAQFAVYPGTGQAQWSLSLSDYDSDPPPTPAKATWIWTDFMIMQGNPQYQGTSDLVVYGTMFWMFAPDTTGELQSLQYVVVPTAIGQTDMLDSTTCPNGLTWGTNRSNGFSWEVAMMPWSPAASLSK